MKICIFGNKETTKSLIQELLLRKIKVSGLVILASSQAKKAEISGLSSDISSLAEEAEIEEVYEASTYNLKNEEDQKYFLKKGFDLGLCTGWQRIIPAEILNTFSVGVFGWHGSAFMLPNGRGRSPLNWSIRLGMNKIFHNCFKYSAAPDEGNIFETKLIKIHNDDYIVDLQKKALNHIKSSAFNLIQAIRGGKLRLKEQISHPSIWLPKLDENSGLISPALLTGFQARCIVRSCSKPFPGSFVHTKHAGGLKIRLWKISHLKHVPQKIDLGVGEAVIMEDRLFIRCLDEIMLSDHFEVEARNDTSFMNNKKIFCL